MERQSNQLIGAERFQTEPTSEGDKQKRQENAKHSYPFILKCLKQQKTYGTPNTGNCPVQQDTLCFTAGAQKLVAAGAQNIDWIIIEVQINLETHSYSNCSNCGHNRRIIYLWTTV